MPTVRAYLGIGSNLGDRAGHVRTAAEALGSLEGVTLLALSDVIETEPVGPIEQGPYLNAAAAVETTLAPGPLLEAIQRIERARGRDRAREQRWGPRTLDIDILVYADLRMHEPGLTIPHPRLAERRFALAPLAQIAPELVVPGTGRTVTELLAALEQGGTA